MPNQKAKKDYTKLVLIIIIVALVVLLALSISNNQLLQGLLLNQAGLAPNADGGGGWRWLS